MHLNFLCHYSLLLIHPDFFDVTETIPIDTVMNIDADNAFTRYKINNYFKRDGRGISFAGCFFVVPKICLDILNRPKMSKDKILSQIYPINKEIKFGYKPDHLIDEYIMSYNLAKYGLKYRSFRKWISTENTFFNGEWIYHDYCINTKEKIEKIKNTIVSWDL